MGGKIQLLILRVAGIMATRMTRILRIFPGEELTDYSGGFILHQRP
jgi:hypothetical protein